MTGRDSASLLALLWNPPHGAELLSCAAGQQWATAYLSRLGIQAADVASAASRVDAAAARATAADLLPGHGPNDVRGPLKPGDTIVHPFAPREVAQPILSSQAAVEAALKRCWAVVGPNATEWQRALAVWRLLPGILPEAAGFAPLTLEEEARGSWRSSTPVADPRYPEDVWTLGAFRAAAVGAGDRPAVLQVTIASVQDYIDQARRTQDLWMGSYFYAYIVWHAMRPIIEEFGPWAILTPDLHGHPFLDLWLVEQGLRLDKLDGWERRTKRLLRVASLPNIFTALVPGGTASTWAEASVNGALCGRNRVADCVKTAVHTTVTTPDPRSKKPVFSDTTWEQRWDEQIGDFLTHDLFWAVAPWDGTDPLADLARLRALNGSAPGSESWDAWRAVATELPPGAGFPLASMLAARLVTTRKNQRDFAQLPDRGGGPLCTLCGVRSALRFSVHTRQTSEDWKAFADIDRARNGSGLKLRGRIRHGEMLCAVCLTKRLAMDAYFHSDHAHRAMRKDIDAAEADLGVDRHHFPSTATVATLPFRKLLIERIHAVCEDPELSDFGGDKDPGLVETVSAWLNALDQAVPPDVRVPATIRQADRIRGDDYDFLREYGYDTGDLEKLDQLDGAWFYPSSYDSDVVYREFGIAPSDHSLNEAKRQLLRLLSPSGPLRKHCLDDNVEYRPPARYYAVINLDGDHIGEWLTGKHNPTFADLRLQTGPGKMKRPPGPASQSALAAAGRTFAFEIAPGIVEAQDGFLVYAGGDDTLALVPRERALDLARALNRAFRQPWTRDGELLLGPKATLSAAIIVAHHSTPLAEVMHEAHGVLKQVAKQRYGRDAFAVQLMKRSGPRVIAGLPWQVKLQRNTGLQLDCAAVLDAVQAGFAGPLSRSLLADVRHLTPVLDVERVDPAGDQERLIRAELQRLSKRHLPDDASVSDHMVQVILDLYDLASSALAESGTKGDGWKFNPLPAGGGLRDRPLPPGQQEHRPTAWAVTAGLLQVAEFLAREDEE